MPARLVGVEKGDYFVFTFKQLTLQFYDQYRLKIIKQKLKKRQPNLQSKSFLKFKHRINEKYWVKRNINLKKSIINEQINEMFKVISNKLSISDRHGH